jgi:hypothetical protein
MKILLFLIPIFVFLGPLFAQEKRQTLFLNLGVQNSWERDYAYSPLVYQGSALGLSLGYSSSGEKKTDEVYLHYSRLPLQNAYNAGLTGTHASIITYTFYKAKWLPEELNIGWSNNNALSLRDFQDAQNFNPRFDFHTSFGPAIRYLVGFGNKQQWRFSAQAHWQLVGFVFSSSYVTSPPDAFLYEQSTFNAFWQSICFFQPFQQHDLGMLNQLFYRLSNGNEVGLGYRFYFTSLENEQRTQRSGGHYFFQLNFRL